MVDPSEIHKQRSTVDQPSRFVFFIRFLLAALVSAALVYPVLFCFVFIAIRGTPQKKTLAILVGGGLVVGILSWRLFRRQTVGANILGMTIVALSWVAAAMLVGRQVLDESGGQREYLGACFGLATLIIPFAIWWFAWSTSVRTRVATGAILSITMVIFLQMLRIDGMAGDESKVAMGWRRSSAVPQIPESKHAPQAATVAVLNEFPQYLGPHRDAVIAGVELQTDWVKYPPQLLWRQPVGAGLGGFAIQGGKGTTLEQVGDKEAVSCYDLLTGKQLWQVQHKGLFSHGLAKSGPRSTPTIAGERVYAIGALGTLCCIELQTGKLLWSVETAVPPGTNLPYGIASSPLVDGNQVIVCQPSADGKCVAAFDCATGQRLWQGGDSIGGYSSPLLAQLSGTQQLLFYTSENLIGLNPNNGSLLWSFPWSNDPKNNCSQPLPNAGSPDHVFVSTGYGKGCALIAIEAGAGELFSVRKIWESRNMRNKFSTSVIIDQTVYGLDDGILAAVDLANGKRLWKKDRIGYGQLLLVGGKILAMCENGDLQLVEVTPKGSKTLGALEGAVDGKTWNCPALAAPYLLLRNDREACCYQLSCLDPASSPEEGK